MPDYDAGRYGKAVGDYDALYPGVEAETEAAVELLAELAFARPERSILELGIGTGRLAIGLRRRGLRVAGIDGSESMVAKLRDKPGGDAIDVMFGDYRNTTAEGNYGVVALVLNGIFDPRGRDAQLDIFRNAARHLGRGGSFVVESWVMNDNQRSGEWSVIPRFVGDRHVEFQLARFNIDHNTIERTLVHLRDGRAPDFVTVTDTYASPGELDLMAHVTGFERIARYADWTRSTFTAASANQISIFTLR